MFICVVDQKLRTRGLVCKYVARHGAWEPVTAAGLGRLGSLGGGGAYQAEGPMRAGDPGGPRGLGGMGGWEAWGGLGAWGLWILGGCGLGGPYLFIEMYFIYVYMYIYILLYINTYSIF